MPRGPRSADATPVVSTTAAAPPSAPPSGAAASSAPFSQAGLSADPATAAASPYAAPAPTAPASAGSAPQVGASTGERRVGQQHRRARWIGLLAMSTAAISNQTGAALAVRAFPAIGPLGVVAIRQLVAAAVLLPLARPPLRRLTWAQWWPCLILAAVFATMNLSLYTAIDRIGLGLAVTLEFVGPLAVALAASRSRRDLALAVLAGAGVYVLVLPSPSSDLIGVGLALLAALCWAIYIVVNRLAGTRLPGLQAAAVGSMVSATGYLPVLIVLAVGGVLTWQPVLLAVAAGLLASAIPYAADLTALRYVPARFFGVFMSVHPVLAAFAGLVILHQRLDLHEWIGIGVVVAANALATIGRPRPR